LFLILTSCWTKAGIAEIKDTYKTVASIGKTTITTKDISYRIAIELSYGNQGATGEAALISLGAPGRAQTLGGESPL